MTEKKGRAGERSPAAPIDRRLPRTDATRFGEMTGARREPYLVWCGGFICIVLTFAALAGIASSSGWLQLGGSQPAIAADRLTDFPQPADRANCAEIGSSDLRSPPEGLWFQANCVAIAESPLMANTASCNRTSLDRAEFTEVASGLYVSRRNAGIAGLPLVFQLRVLLRPRVSRSCDRRVRRSDRDLQPGSERVLNSWRRSGLG